MNIQFNFRAKIDCFYPYRTARVMDTQFSVEDDPDGTMWKKLQRYLHLYGYRLDNHVCWTVGNVHYMYSDSRLRIGTELRVENW